MIEILKQIKKNTFGKIFPSGDEKIDRFLIKELRGFSSVLDLGCGGTINQLSRFVRIQKALNPKIYSVGVDIFKPYIIEAKKTRVHSEYINADIFSIEFPEKSFDCAILLDVIEHVEKEEFFKFLPKLEKMCKKIIILTPNGYLFNEEVDNNFYQIHKSGWTVKELTEAGFKCFGVLGFKFLRKEGAYPKIKPDFIGNMICDLTEPFIFHNPKLARHIICVKKCSL